MKKNVMARPALVGLVAGSLMMVSCLELNNADSIDQGVVLEPYTVEQESAEYEPIVYTPLTVDEKQGVEITLYNETMFGAYTTGYPVYGTDIVLECDYTACYANGYYAIVINEYWSEKYPRGTTGSIEYNGVGYPVMVVDYRALEHSTDYYDVGFILGETVGGLKGAYIYE